MAYLLCCSSVRQNRFQQGTPPSSISPYTSFEHSSLCRHLLSVDLLPSSTFHVFPPPTRGLSYSALHAVVRGTTMASADFWPPIPRPRDCSSTRQVTRSPRVRRATFTLIPAAYTSAVSVQVPGFEDILLLTHSGRLVCDSCSSGQCFAFGFLQTPPRGGHPCRSANRSPCRAGRGLPPRGHPLATTARGTAPGTALRAMPGAQMKKLRKAGLYFIPRNLQTPTSPAAIPFLQPRSSFHQNSLARNL